MLVCQKCGKTYPNDFLLKCGCGGILNTKLEDDKSYKNLLKAGRIEYSRYSSFTVVSNNYLPDLKPSITPVVRKNIDGVKVIFKLEYLMPSFSFKDRGTYVSFSVLNKNNINEISLDSSGNAAISLSLFGKSEQKTIHVFIPRKTSSKKKKLLKNLGANIHEIEGSRMDVHEKAEEFERAQYISHWLNPYFLDGTKITAYELQEQIGDVDHIITPTGSGTMLLGFYKGFKELKKFDKIKKLPKITAVEAEGYENLGKWSEEKSELAEGIEIVNPPRKNQIIQAIEETDGYSLSIGDRRIKDSVLDLTGMGFMVESTSAIAYSAFKEMLETKKVDKGERVVIPLTGSNSFNF